MFILMRELAHHVLLVITVLMEFQPKLVSREPTREILVILSVIHAMQVVIVLVEQVSSVAPLELIDQALVVKANQIVQIVPRELIRMIPEILNATLVPPEHIIRRKDKQVVLNVQLVLIAREEQIEHRARLITTVQVLEVEVQVIVADVQPDTFHLRGLILHQIAVWQVVVINNKNYG